MSSLPTLPSRRRAIAALVVVNAMWGSSFPIVKSMNLQIDQHFAVTEWTASHWLRGVSAAWVIGIRFAAALVLFLLLYRTTLRRVGLPHVLSGVAVGTLFFMGLLLQVVGLGTIPASRSGFLTSLAVVFTPLIGTLIRRRMPRVPVILAAVLALLGTAILTGLFVWDETGIGIAADARQKWTLGDSLTTLAALFFSGQILLVDQLGKRYDSVAFTPSMFASTALLAFAVFVIFSGQIPETSAGGWATLAMQPSFYGLMALLVVFPSLLAFVWMNKYQPSLSAGEAAVVYTMEPLFASFWAMCLPVWLSVWCLIDYQNERFSLPLVIGGTLVLAANVLALWEPGKAELPPRLNATA
ncbi:DMT family transporter [Roseimaritima ulvae]|nr:DMT family transporter [Roseimaritima ulvae]